MARVHPQDNVDVLQAARREATYECEFVIDAVVPADLSPVSLPYSDKASGEKAIADKVAQGRDQPLSRLVAALAGLRRITASLGFSLDDYDRPVVRGEVTAEVVLPCQRCLEEVPITLAAPLHSVIWLSVEPPAKELALGCADLIISPTTTVSFAALVEDDLLLALPDRVCQQDDCPRVPILSYPARSQTGQGTQASHAKARDDDDDDDNDDDKEPLGSDRQLPFAGLRDLLDDSADL